MGQRVSQDPSSKDEVIVPLVRLTAQLTLRAVPFAGLAPGIDSSTLAQPMVFDATGDMSIDLFGYKAGDAKTPVLWENVWAKSEHTSLFNL